MYWRECVYTARIHLCIYVSKHKWWMKYQSVPYLQKSGHSYNIAWTLYFQWQINVTMTSTWAVPSAEWFHVYSYSSYQYLCSNIQDVSFEDWWPLFQWSGSKFWNSWQFFHQSVRSQNAFFQCFAGSLLMYINTLLQKTFGHTAEPHYKVRGTTNVPCVLRELQWGIKNIWCSVYWKEGWILILPWSLLSNDLYFQSF